MILSWLQGPFKVETEEMKDLLGYFEIPWKQVYIFFFAWRLNRIHVAVHVVAIVIVVAIDVAIVVAVIDVVIIIAIVIVVAIVIFRCAVVSL